MATIGIFDSGVGGLSVLREIKRELPRSSFIYFADSANCPYGSRTPEFIIERSRSIVRMLLERKVDIVVVACNTATAAAISTLRKEFSSTPFVGMEPAVKPAALGTGTGVIGVLATEGTLKASKYLDTKGRVSPGVKVVEHIGSGFVELVEKMELSGPKAESIAKESLLPLVDAGADIIVLGCTHYPFLLPVLEKVAPAGLRFIDPAPAIARRARVLLEERGVRLEEESPETTLLSSGDPSVLKALAATFI